MIKWIVQLWRRWFGTREAAEVEWGDHPTDPVLIVSGYTKRPTDGMHKKPKDKRHAKMRRDMAKKSRRRNW